MLKLLKKYHNPEKFNEDFIYSKKKDEKNILSYIDDILKALEIIEGIEYIGSKFIDDIPKQAQEISKSRLYFISSKFKLTVENETKEREIKFLIPKLVDNFYFLINGNKFTPIYQIVDAETYTSFYKGEKKLTLKTLFLPIVIINEKKIFSNEEISIEGKKFILQIFGKNINFLSYYFAKFGIEKTIEFFGFKGQIGITNSLKDYTDKYYIFTIKEKNLYVYISKNDNILKTDLGNDFAVSFLSILEKKSFKKASSIEEWKKTLGEHVTKNKNTQLNKSEKMLLSFERILDGVTKKILNNINNTYELIRWMFENYYELIERDNMDLKNKRLRMYEYILNPLLNKVSKNTYRILNKTKKNTTMNQLDSLFNNIKLNIILKPIKTSELLRYNNATNGMDLFNSALKVSAKGPQSIVSSANSEVSTKYRGLHPSYLGKISLTFASAQDPGMTFMLSPFIKMDGLFFEKRKK